MTTGNKILNENSEINTIQDNDSIIGYYDHIHDFYSTYTKNERDIIVWLPPSYNSGIKKYPVLYMHDGQNLFNPSTSFSGYDWKVDETITQLISRKIIHETIVVGIYNTKDRLKEYNLFNRRGIKYAQFLINELKPYIDENYRTLKKQDNTAVMGSSMGGLCSFQLLMNFPGVFGKAACMSNSFWIDDREIFKFIEEHKIPEFSKLYIDCGLKESELIDDNLKMCSIISSFSGDTGKFYCYFSEEGKHNEYDWAQRLHIPLKFLFGINNA